MNETAELDSYLREYASSHSNVSAPEYRKRDPWRSGEADLNILNKIKLLHPEKSLPELLPEYTLQAAREIFEEEVLGSIEPGKTPGLILVSGLDAQTLKPLDNAMMKVLV